LHGLWNYFVKTDNNLFLLFHQNIFGQTDNSSKFVSKQRVLGCIFRLIHIMQSTVLYQDQKFYMCFHRVSTQIACQGKILTTVL